MYMHTIRMKNCSVSYLSEHKWHSARRILAVSDVRVQHLLHRGTHGAVEELRATQCHPRTRNMAHRAHRSMREDNLRLLTLRRALVPNAQLRVRQLGADGVFEL